MAMMVIISEVRTEPVLHNLHKPNIRQMQKNDEEKSDPEKISFSPTPIGDPELLYEERLGELIADNENHIRDKKELQKELRDLHDRLTRLQEDNVGVDYWRQTLTNKRFRTQIEND